MNQRRFLHWSGSSQWLRLEPPPPTKVGGSPGARMQEPALILALVRKHPAHPPTPPRLHTLRMSRRFAGKQCDLRLLRN